jgi:hypothetical protein
MTIRLSCTLYVAWKIVQLGIPSCTPIWPASSRSAQLAAFRRPLKPGRPTPGSCFLPGCIRGRAANVSARASTRVIVAGPLAAAGRRTPRHGPNFLFAPSPLSLCVRSEGEGDGYRWRRPRRQGCVAGSRAFRAPLQRDRLAVGGRGRGDDKPKSPFEKWLNAVCGRDSS